MPATGDAPYVREHLDQFRAPILRQVPEAEHAVMTIAEQMRQQGKAEGRAEGKAATLLKQLGLKFGVVGAEHQARVKNATAEELDPYIERVLTADSLEAVFAA